MILLLYFLLKIFIAMWFIIVTFLLAVGKIVHSIVSSDCINIVVGGINNPPVYQCPPPTSAILGAC